MYGKTLSSKNKGLLHIPIDKTRTIFERIFILMGHLGGKKEGVSNSPQWDGFLEVLSTSNLRFFSLVDVENPMQRVELKGSKMAENGDQVYRSRVI